MKEKEKMSLVDLGKRLLEASRNGQADEVSMLMASGAPFTTDWLGTSPLHLAAQHGHTQTAEVLLRAGVSRDARTKVDRTPLHMAAQNGHTGIVELLISGGACVNNKDMLNMTPLHWACERGHVEIIKILLRSGANLDVASKFNKTPQDIARQKGHNEALALLVSDQDQSKIPVNIKRQADRSNLGLNALKKRQRTKKFPMTAGTWTGTDGPGGKGECGVKNRKKATTPGSLPKSAVANGRRVSAPPQYPNAGSPSLRSPTANSIASLVSAADFVKRESYSEGPESKKPAVSKATSEQDSSILNTLATLATANMSQSSVVSTSTAPQQATSIAARSSGVTPLSLPSNTSAALSSLTTPLTPSGNFWAPIPSPLTALSVLSSLTSPAQLSPLPNFAMSPFTVPVTISPQGVPTGQHYLPFVNSGAALTQTTATSVSTAIAAASTATEAVAVPIGGVAMTSSDNAAHATMSQAFTIPSLSVTGMSNQCQATSQYALLAPHQVSTSPTLMLDAAQFGILNGAAAGGSRVEQGKPAAVQETSQDSTETKPDESLPQTAQASSGQELLVTLQVPAGLQHVFPSQIVTGDQPITLQQIQLVPQVVNQEPAGYLTPQVVGPVSQVQSGASVVQASQPQFSVQTAVVPQSASSQDSGTQTQCPPVNPPRTSPPPTSTKTPNQDQLATTQASQNNLLSTQGQSSILLQSQSPSPVLVQGQGQVVLQGQGQVITGQLAQQPLQQVVVGSQLQQSATSAQQTVTQSQSFSQGQAASQRVTSVPQQNQQQISQQLLQQSIPGAGTSLPGTTSTAASIQSLLQQSFVPQLSQVVIQGGADSSQVTQGSQTQLAPHHVLLQVQEEYRKILEQKQAEEERTRKDLQEKLFALQRDSEKYRDELEQAQREAENYKGKLEAESRERVRLHQLYEASKQSPSEELTPVTSVKQEAEKMA